MANKTNYTIKLDSKPAKKLRTILTLLLVAAILVFLSNAGNAYFATQKRQQAREAKKAATNIELVVTGKANESAYGDNVKFKFTIDIQNSGKVDVNYVEGVFTVMDKDGNVLTCGDANFGTDLMNTPERSFSFPAKSTKTYTLTWNADLSDDIVELWETDFADLRFSFEMTRLRVENKQTADVA